MHKGQVLLQKGYGWQNIQDSVRNDKSTIYQIGSCTKPFTATLILLLQEQGKLSVTDNLNKYFPDYPHGEKITLHHLLTHTSGIINYNETDAFLNADESEAVKPKRKEQIINLFQNKPLAFKPGTKYNYSNSGYFLLGCVIEEVTKKPYEHAMRELLLQPLQMNQSGFDFINLRNPNKATGYTLLNDTLQKPASFLFDSTISYAAGALYSTVEDLYQWSKAISTGKLLTAETWEKAFKPNKANYGYGWINGSVYNKKFIGHSGGTKGFSSHFVWFPDEDVSITLLSNVAEDVALGTTTISLAAILFDKPYAVPRRHQEIKVPASILQQYVGAYQYKFTPNRKFIISLEKGRLIARKKGESDVTLYPETTTKFFLKTIEAQMEFIKKDDKVDKTIIHQNGEYYTWEKIK